MKAKILNIASCLLLIALFLGGCKGIDAIEITNIDHFELQGIEENTIVFTTDVNVYNPSGVAFKVREINLRAMADGNYLGLLTSDEMIRIPARSDSVYNMQFNLRLSNIFSGASILFRLSKQEQVNVELQGYIRSRSGLITKKIEVQESRVIEVPALDYFN